MEVAFLFCSFLICILYSLICLKMDIFVEKEIL